MMNWYISGLLAAFSFAVLFLCYNKLKNFVPIGTYMFYISIFSGGIILIFLKEMLIPAKFIILTLLASILSWAGMYLYNLAMKKENNIGYIEATFSTRIPLIYIFSIIYFNCEIDYFKLIPLFLMIIGLLTINDFKLQSFNFRKEKTWIIYASFASLSTVGMTIICKLLLESGISSAALTAWILLFSSLIFLFTSIIKKDTLRIKRRYISILITAIVITCIGNILMFNSFDKAPNLSYVSSILSFRIVLLYMASVFMKYDKFELRKAFAILICFLSVCLF